MHRLGGGLCDEDNIELRKMQISESQKSDSLHYIHMQSRTVANEEQLVAVTERMMSLELQQNDPIPKNIKSKYYSNIFIICS